MSLSESLVDSINGCVLDPSLAVQELLGGLCLVDFVDGPRRRSLVHHLFAAIKIAVAGSATIARCR